MSDQGRIIRYFRSLLEAACFCLVISFVIVVMMTVIYRYVLNSSLPWSEEFIRFSLFWCVILGAVLVSLDDDHLRIEILQLALPDWARRILIGLAHCVTLGFCLSLAYYGYDLVQKSGSTSPALGFPMKYVYLAMVVGGIGISLATIWRIIVLFRSKSS